jgi:hypothetical protein
VAALLLIGASRLVAAEFTVTNTNNSGPGSLYQAIADANADLDRDTIRFNIPGSGVHVIDISGKALPDIIGPVVIDGYTQPGSRPNTLSVGDDAVILIQVKGNGAPGNRNGFAVTGGNSLIRGLSITSLYVAVWLHSTLGGDAVEGCFVGVDPSGQLASGAVDQTVIGGPTVKVSNSFGLFVESPLATIGGSGLDKRNVISGNLYAATIRGRSAAVAGNYVGTDATGTTAIPNGTAMLIGVNGTVDAQTVIGGPAPTSGNLISGNAGTAIQVGDFSLGGSSFAADYAVISHNVIGTTADGVGRLGNATGIHIYDSNHTVIGGIDPAAGNVIAFSTFAGVAVDNFVSGKPCLGNSILSNRIYGSGTRPIVLMTNRSDAPVLNDPGDPDTGPNNRQNYPMLTSSSVANGVVTTKGTLNSIANTSFTIQFFADSRNLAAPNQTYLGSTTVTTDGSGNAAFTVSFPLADGNVFITATATNDATGDTSELYDSVPRLVNISTRLGVQTGDNILIAGFIVRGESTGVTLRGLGPSLNLSGTLQDPVIDLYDSTGKLLAENNNWRDETSNSSLGVLTPTNNSESVLIRSLPAGAYTVTLRGNDGGMGVGLVEIYLTWRKSPYSELANLSSRGLVGTGDNVMIGGFIVGGTGPARYLIRAPGPSLVRAGIANPLSDPMLELHGANGELIGMNDNWSDDDAAAIQETGLAPSSAAEPAINVFLDAGAYTAIVRGKNDSTGVALVEVYNLH